MPMLARAALLILSLSICAQAQTRTLALFVGPVQGLDPAAAEVARKELRRILTPAGIQLSWKNLGQRTEEEFETVVVGSFDGSCSIADLPSSQQSLAANTTSLGDTSVANGRVLPYLRVDCARLVRMMAPALQTLDAPTRSAIFARGLARVIAHEIYHIVAGTTEHESAGVAKPSFSVLDLTTGRLDFNVASLVRMRPLPVASLSNSGDSSEAAGR